MIKTIYEDSFKYCSTVVTRNNGQLDDARDLFQESIMVLFRKVHEDDFVLTCTPRTYLYSVMRNLWLKRLDKAKRGQTVSMDDESKSWVEVHIEEDQTHEEREQKYGVVDRAIRQIKEDCQRLLKQFYFAKVDLKSLAEEMDYTYQFIKVKKNRCMNALKRKVEELKQAETDDV